MTDATSRTLLPVASGARVRATVGALMRQNPGRVTAVGVLYLAASGLGVVMPASLGGIVDAVSTNAGILLIGFWVGAAGAGAVGAAVVSMCAARVLAGLVQDMLASLREDVFATAMRLPVSTIDDGESADLLSRVTGDVDAVAEAGGSVAPNLLSAGFAITTSIATLAVLDPWLALAGLTSLPLYAVGTRRFLRRSRVVFREVREREADRSQAVLETVEGIETLTALNGQEDALGRVRARAETAIRMQVEGVRVTNGLFRYINGGELVGLTMILATGFVLQSAGTITVGTVTTAALLFHRLFGPVGQVIFGLDDIQRATIGLARLVGVIDLGPSAPPTPVSASEPPAHAGVELQDVTFLYPTTGRGIHEVSLSVAAGTTTAVVGSSGSGKSTLARVVAGHHTPVAGRVRLAPAASRPYYVSQEVHHFRGTIAENLRLVAPEADDDALIAVLRVVGAQWAAEALNHDARDTSSRGADADVDEGRVQQLAIARAMLADPDVVILDEATAEIGEHHRAAVEHAIGALRASRTVLMIVHRLQQAMTADQIVVFADGRAVQCGTHDDLLAADGPYRRSWLAHAPLALESPRQSPTPVESEETEHP
ncbi:ABC-type multidrug transport system fused ATPase/permease subunit [Microbacterium sp. SORGH_AS 1204]|uniref:ABC transporter ATP-binding protein n=1 Tax=Microbacterium sp. SORGH_AS_1204 TaxID=3041785 RepID=UPI00279268AE|nr:ABC transporter ATP-binding protein [Microbacterium sp. SORGH_AS_1204]MDQ1135906.1 ABC-type multidrug transport system fused ATPase/permease subunit [Microbacterium sp. SORGH_AS_1204]